MAVVAVDIITFIQLGFEHLILDVRSNGEYDHAHIPGAVSLPLFDNVERSVVGTAYKKQSREKAIKIGLELFGKKMVSIVEQVEELTSSQKVDKESNKKVVLLHCWRGGMRSAGVAWLLDLYGFKVYTLKGGYKNFRNWVLAQFSKTYPFQILGGYTGSGKTFVLHELKKTGATTVDLEEIAHHRGSAFGYHSDAPQPSQEMFENTLAVQLQKADQEIAGRKAKKGIEEIISPIWLEDESQRIGSVIIPTAIWNQMRVAPVMFVEIPFEERLKHIVEGYGKCPKDQLVNAIIRIKKRLGGQETKLAINYLLEDNTNEAFRILLTYYDRLYAKGLKNRETLPGQIVNIQCDTVEAGRNATSILEKQ